MLKQFTKVSTQKKVSRLSTLYDNQDSLVSKLMQIDFIEEQTPYQFVKIMTDEALRTDLAHQLLIFHSQCKGKKSKSFKDDVEEMERTEKYLRYVLKYATKD